MILPYMEGGNIYNSVATNSWDVGPYVVKSYISPGDPTAPSSGLQNGNRGATSYAGNFYVFGDINGHDSGSGSSQAAIPRSFPDGQSDTIVFAEWYTACGTGNGNSRIWSEDGQGSWGGDWDEPSFYFTGGFRPPHQLCGRIDLSAAAVPAGRVGVQRRRCSRRPTPAASWWAWATAACASSARA